MEEILNQILKESCRIFFFGKDSQQGLLRIVRYDPEKSVQGPKMNHVGSRIERIGQESQTDAGGSSKKNP